LVVSGQVVLALATDLVQVLVALSSEARCALASLGNLGSVGLSELFLSFVAALQIDRFSADTVSFTRGLARLSRGIATFPVEGILLSFVLVLGLGGRLAFF